LRLEFNLPKLLNMRKRGLWPWHISGSRHHSGGGAGQFRLDVRRHVWQARIADITWQASLVLAGSFDDVEHGDRRQDDGRPGRTRIKARPTGDRNPLVSGSLRWSRFWF
jgi:hypothetical protein